jgi:hypothetical protein
MMRNIMNNTLFAILLLFGLGFTAFTSAQQRSIKNRPAEVSVTFTNSKTYKGSYNGHAISRYCGQFEPLYPGGSKNFGVSYPVDLENPDDPIRDVTFTSAELVDGVRQTGKFHVEVDVKSPAMGHPAAYVVNTTNPNDQSSGQATITPRGDDLDLIVRATDALGAKLELVVTCHAPQR